MIFINVPYLVFIAHHRRGGSGWSYLPHSSLDTPGPIPSLLTQVTFSFFLVPRLEWVGFLHLSPQLQIRKRGHKTTLGKWVGWNQWPQPLLGTESFLLSPSSPFLPPSLFLPISHPAPLPAPLSLRKTSSYSLPAGLHQGPLWELWELWPTLCPFPRLGALEGQWAQGPLSEAVQAGTAVTWVIAGGQGPP